MQGAQGSARRERAPEYMAILLSTVHCRRRLKVRQHNFGQQSIKASRNGISTVPLSFLK